MNFSKKISVLSTMLTYVSKTNYLNLKIGRRVGLGCQVAKKKKIDPNDFLTI